MTRRLALAILLSVWGILVIGEVTAYLAVRSILITDLDALLYARAVALPELVHPAGFDPSDVPQYDWTDVYTIQSDPDRAAGPRNAKPAVIEARFTRSEAGQRQRTLRVAALGRGASRTTGGADGTGGAGMPVVVTYSGSTAQMDAVLRRTAWALFIFGTSVGVLAAGVSVLVSRITLRPLKSTAQAISLIDEQRLNDRISTDQLPPELAPVAGRLNEMLERLEQAFTRQKLFLANASHELRTPVAALATTLQITLRHPRDAESYRQTLVASLGQVEVLRTLVDRLIEYISNESGADERVELVDITGIVNECADAAAAIGSTRDVSVVRSVPRDLKCYLQADRLRSIVMNLLSNAVEHNRAGGTVRLTCFHDTQHLQLRVADDGPGIAAEHLPHLFTPFYRADTARRQRNGHLGLGLFFVQSHVRAMGGQCRVDTQVGQGTAFDVEVPCKRAHAAHLDAAPA